MMKHRRRSAKGFSLIEVVVALGIAAVLTSVAVVNVHAATNRSRVNGQVRQMLDDISKARAEAPTGRRMATNNTLWVRSAGIRIVSPTRYQILAYSSDDGVSAAATDVLKTVDIARPGAIFASQYPVNIVFRSNGSLVRGSATALTFRDTNTNRTHGIEISLTGSTRVQ